jgi:hypothetical protein
VSTKVYTAYRLKRSEDLWAFVRDIRRQAMPAIHKVLQELFLGLAEELRRADPALSGSDLRIAAEQRLTREYRDQLGKGERNTFDFDVNITIREHEGRLYLIPYCDMFMRDVLDFLKDDPRLEDFAYWDNSDQPEDVSDADWAARKALWDAMDSGCTIPDQLYSDAWSDYLVFEICSYHALWKIKPRFKLEI